jgi:lipid II:glycine glycyltransferase (peptidoglycan interpeptide bridge formation enzyme)
MPEVSLTRWDEFLQAKGNVHFLQTGAWGEFKGAFGWEPVRVIRGELGAQILFRKLPLGLTLGYMPKADLEAASVEVSAAFWGEVDGICRARRAILCKVEPDGWQVAGAEDRVAAWLRAGGGRQVSSPHSIQPRRTIIVDLRGSEDAILARMKPKCRYNIRLAAKKGVTVEPWSDIAAFHRMVETTGRRDSFAVHSEAYYRRAFEVFRDAGICELLVARFEGRRLAAIMVFARGKRAWYVYGGSTDLERERMPNYLLQWEAMRWAKNRRCEEYDLWGVPDEDEQTLEAAFEKRHDGLWGVYRFKRGFGGELKRAVAPVDRVYQPLLYRLYLNRAAGREST